MVGLLPLRPGRRYDLRLRHLGGNRGLLPVHRRGGKHIPQMVIQRRHRFVGLRQKPGHGKGNGSRENRHKQAVQPPLLSRQGAPEGGNGQRREPGSAGCHPEIGHGQQMQGAEHPVDPVSPQGAETAGKHGQPQHRFHGAAARSFKIIVFIALHLGAAQKNPVCQQPAAVQNRRKAQQQPGGKDAPQHILHPAVPCSWKHQQDHTRQRGGQQPEPVKGCQRCAENHPQKQGGR